MSLTTAREKDMTAFEDCVTFHLLTVFSEDSAEQQRYYINMSLKKPGKVTIRDFVERIKQLNSYLGRLPGLIDSPKKTKKTKAVEPFDEPELAQLILKMCPGHWQDQYALTQGNIPQDIWSLLVVLETIENCQEKVPKKIPGKFENGGKSDKKKRKVSFKEENKSKKARTTKHCELCKKHGGAHTTHNTGDCKKYEKDGTEKKGFKNYGKSGSKNQGYAQFEKKFEKLEKVMEKLYKSSRKSKKNDREYDSDSS